jgi:translation initiation factor IF-2
MSETKDTGDKKLRLSAGGKTLSFRRSVGETGRVKQSFSQGRSKTVVVEKKRSRTLRLAPERAETAPTLPAASAPAPAERQAEARAPEPELAGDGQDRRAGVVLRTLTEEEKDARAHALAEARVREAEERKQALAEARHREREEERLAREQAEAEARQAEEEQRRHREEESRKRAEEEARRREDETSAATTEGETGEPGRRRVAQPRPVRPRAPSERRRGKLTVTKALDDSPRERSLASMRRRRERERRQAMGELEPQAKIAREVTIPEAITIQELANRMAERAVDVIKLLMKQGQMLKINDVIDADTAQLIAEELGHTVKRVSEADVEEGLHGEDDDPADLGPRAPVVTVMGHVDHGKTSLLDALRESDVASGEAGGITQHIGAYQVTVPSGQKVTFIDTPGHAAFTAMRARGARVTDIVVLVVAADDGVMPQTVEAIHHAREAGVPIIVAINKIDVPGADPKRVRTELLQHEVVVESMSGETLEIEVSALKRTNLDKLVEAIILQAEIAELTANPNRPAEGIVIEAKLDRGRGPVATVLVQRGTLKVGDIIVLGSEWGRVRALVNDRGDNITEAGPSMPIEVLGLNGTPEAGDRFAAIESEARAREITEYRQRKRRDLLVAGAGERATLEQMMNQLQESGRKEFPILVKADVQGSVEAITSALDQLATEEVAARVIHGGVGAITESDVTLAAASGAVILAFNVRPNVQAREASARSGTEIRTYSVIYHLVDDVRAAMSGLLEPTIRETTLGNAEILEVFHISKVGKVAGCRVTDGVVRRGEKVRLVRDNVVIHEGMLSTLKRFQDEVREVQAGQECGMSFESYQDLKQGDVIECFSVETIERKL